jgi:hypothetical protein
MKMNNMTKIANFVLLILCGISLQNGQAQVTVGLDNWYNHETNSKTGKLAHYLWTDSTWGGYSRWGKIFTDKGVALSTLGHPDAASLAKINVYIIVDPDTTSENPTPNYLTAEDIRVIAEWVKNGGVLALLGNDGANCEFTHFNELASRFGITFNHVCFHPVTGKNYEMGASTNLPNHTIFTDVKKIYIKEISTINIMGPAKSILTEDGKVLMAESKVGKGTVFAIGDPWIYNEYIDHDRLPVDFDNRKAAENLSDYLLLNAKKK